MLTGRDAEVLSSVVKELGARGVRALAAPADLTDPPTLAEAVADAEGVFGPIDVLVNNAGVAGPTGPLWETDEDEWWRTFEVNVRGTAYACRAVLPGMTARRFGRVINIVSEAGRRRWPHASAYSVSKAAVIKLTENLAGEVRAHGVRVFSYHPGLLDLGITGDHLRRHPTGDPWEDLVGDWLLAQRTAGRFTEPERAAGQLVRIAAGEADELSGGYLTPDCALPAALPGKDCR